MPSSRTGRPVKNSPTGFPLFFDKRKPRIVTGDPWAFLYHLATTKLPAETERIACAYVEQAFDFYDVASNPRRRSKPLLYYYSFLNLVKAALLIRGVELPPAVHHGISDPKANYRERLRLEGQSVRVQNLASDRSQIFPEFAKALGATAAPGRSYRVVKLLSQIPTIHRTYTQVTGEAPNILPIRSLSLFHGGGHVWARLALERDDKDVELVRGEVVKRRAFLQTFRQVRSDKADEMWYESEPEAGRTSGIDKGLESLADKLRPVGFSSILTRAGYRFYLSSLAPSERLPRLAATYAVAFYLGSITRYKPQDFEKIVGGGYRWVVEEYLKAEPLQFVYTLASWLAGVDVVKPYASSR